MDISFTTDELRALASADASIFNGLSADAQRYVSDLTPRMEPWQSATAKITAAAQCACENADALRALDWGIAI